MKRFCLRTVWLLLGAIILQQCTDHGEAVTLEKIQFNVGLADTGNADGRSKHDEVPDALLISLENSAGEAVVNRERITLLRMGDSFITEPLELPPGSYSITDFMLVKAETKVFFAAPRNGSVLSTVVGRSLPYHFVLGRNKVSNIAMEVIDVSYHSPEDFGYEVFPGNELNVLDLGIFIQPDNHTFTDASAYLLEGTDTVGRYDLEAGINEISFRGDPLVARKFVVVKPGCNTTVKEFVYAYLMADLGGEPWKIGLYPSIFTIIPAVQHYRIGLGGHTGTILIDWGDGTGEARNLEFDIIADHHYGSVGTYLVTITGDLDKIERFYSSYDHGAVKSINLQGLTHLNELRMSATHTPAVIDLSHNTQLQFVMIAGAPRFKTVILPQNLVIQYMDVGGPNQMTQGDIDYLIDRVYESVVANHTMSGYFLLNRTPADTHLMLGPPSPDRIEKLIELKDTYGWNVSPTPF